MTDEGYTLPSSVLEFVLPHHMASLIRGGANAGPWRNEELCPKGTPRRDADATTPPNARNSSPCYQKKLKQVKILEKQWFVKSGHIWFHIHIDVFQYSFLQNIILSNLFPKKILPDTALGSLKMPNRRTSQGSTI